MPMSDRYTRTAMGLHWTIAALIVCAFALGWIMTELAISPLRLRMFNWHKWVGMSVLALAVVRVSWRLLHPPPQLLPMPAWQSRAAHGLHLLLYVLLFALPFSGWAYSNAAGYPIVYLGLMRLPDLVTKDKALAQILVTLHHALGWMLLVALCMHAAAALKHHFIDRDGTLRRMWPASLLLLLGLFTMLGARAADARIDSARSTVAATFSQQGVPVEAPFRRFSGTIAYDANNVAGSSATLTVAMDSLDIGDEAYNAEVRKKPWFDSAKFPAATFRSTAIKPGTGGRLDATGILTLKGKSQTMTVPVRVRPSKGATTFDGTFVISRKTFQIGDPIWEDVLDDKVTIRFTFVVDNS